MTEHRPPACHYDRRQRARVTKNGHPCEAAHCLICGHTHTTQARPDTCSDCEAKIVADLRDLQTAYDQLPDEAIEGAPAGTLLAAAPIPGGNALVLHGPTVRIDKLRVSAVRVDRHKVITSLSDHYRSDPIPPIAVLAQWEELYRAWLGHTQPPTPRPAIAHPNAPRPSAKPLVAATISYLTQQLPYIANHATSTGAPDWPTFARQIRTIRAGLENQLHDERDHDLGVECFNCGDRLVRRYKDRRRCRHDTPARQALAQHLADMVPARAMVDQLDEQHLAAMEAGLPFRPPITIEARRVLERRALLPSPAMLTAARMPCSECAKKSMGGIDDPSPSQSWECLSCGRTYNRADYAHAIRLSATNSATADEWFATVQAAADAVTDITEREVSAKTIRLWIERGDDIAVACMWRPGMRFGVQIVSWPDVLRRALEQRRRGRRVAS